MPNCIRSTLAVTMNGNVLWITAPLQLINKTPSTLTIRQHGLLTIVSPVSKPSDSLLATTPLVHVDTPSEKLRMSSSPPLLCPCLRSRSFENQLDALEARLKSRPFVSTDSDSDETLFSCLVALPTNQKEVIALPVRVNTTFEDLLVACWKTRIRQTPLLVRTITTSFISFPNTLCVWRWVNAYVTSEIPRGFYCDRCIMVSRVL